MEQLAKAGVFTGCCSPVLPGLSGTTGENLSRLLRQTAEAGGRFCYCWPGLTMREGRGSISIRALDREFPGLREKYEKRYGTRYRCTVPGAAKLYAWVREECSRLGLLSEMEAIIAVSRRGTTSAACRVRQACFHRALVRAGTHGRRLPFIKGELSSGIVFHRCGTGVLKNVRFRFRQRSSGAGILQSPGERAKIGELKNYPFNGMDRRDYLCNCF